jgi:hypothetical protein
MFEVTQLDVCPKTGITSFEIKWKLGRGVKTDQGSFMKFEDAIRYIDLNKRSYILIMYDDFVDKCRINFEIGDSEYYQHESKLTALERCSKYTHWFETKDLQTITKVIQAIQDDLRKILPKPSDKSFPVLEGKIMDMIIFCKKELNISSTPSTR